MPAFFIALPSCASRSLMIGKGLKREERNMRVGIELYST
jgi:hypothetical protein